MEKINNQERGKIIKHYNSGLYDGMLGMFWIWFAGHVIGFWMSIILFIMLLFFKKNLEDVSFNKYFK